MTKAEQFLGNVFPCHFFAGRKMIRQKLERREKGSRYVVRVRTHYIVRTYILVLVRTRSYYVYLVACLVVDSLPQIEI